MSGGLSLDHSTFVVYFAQVMRVGARQICVGMMACVLLGTASFSAAAAAGQPIANSIGGGPIAAGEDPGPSS